MKIIIDGDPKEIASLVLAVQGRQKASSERGKPIEPGMRYVQVFKDGKVRIEKR